jgi:hypothetical protein
VSAGAAAGPQGESLPTGVTAGDLRRFRAEEGRARAILAGWIGHPAVPGILERAGPRAAAAVAPVRRYLADQVEVIGLSWFTVGIAAVLPGWRMASHTWQVSPQERAAMPAVKAALRTVVDAAADELADAGVPLMPSWPGDLAVVGELLLLKVIGIKIPWDVGPRELADLLQPPPAGAIDADAGGTRVRRGTSDRGERDVTGLRRGYEVHLHGRQPTAPYAGGGIRATREPARQRRAALRRVLAAYQARRRAWTRTGLPRSAPARSGRYGCLLYPGDGGALPDRMPCPASTCRFSAASPCTPHLHPTSGATLHEASTEVHAIHPSGLPSPVVPGWDRNPRAFP